MDAARLQLDAPFVAFVGAGASAIAPSNLPTWGAFNRMLLDALCQRLDQLSRYRQPTDQMLQTLLARRDHTQFLTPDFQAQLIEEEVGADYFAVWQSLPATAFSPVHATLAVLASQGRLAAVVTTNFDTLIEAALRSVGVAFSLHHDSASFDALARGAGSGLPVIKIHGSIDDPGSLVDTLRQRLAGRPPALQSLLDGWLQQHRWLFLGYSGADFTHAPNHLNLLALADVAAGFVFVQRPGAPLEPGVARLQQAYGEGKALVIEADLAGFLPAAFAIGGAAMPVPPGPPSSADEVLASVRQGVAGWVERLGPMAVVNIVVALLRSWGDDAAALRLLRDTAKWYRTQEDAQGASYQRFNLNFGVVLREAGFLFNRVSLADDMGNFIEWKAGADLSAFEYLARNHHATADPAIGAALAGVLAYRGEVGRALAMLRDAVDGARAKGEALTVCDVALDAAIVFDIVQVFGPAIELLREAHGHAVALGDVLRAARLAAWLGRFLSYAGRMNEARPWLDEAEAVAAQFDRPGLRRAAASARAVSLLDSERFDEAVALLQPLADALRAGDAVPILRYVDSLEADAEPIEVTGNSALRVRVLLDLNRAAMLSGQVALMEATLDELDVLTINPFRGYCPAYYVGYVQCLAQYGASGSRDLIDDLLSRLDRLGEEQGNPWCAQAAAFVRQQLPPAAGASD